MTTPDLAPLLAMLDDFLNSATLALDRKQQPYFTSAEIALARQAVAALRAGRDAVIDLDAGDVRRILSDADFDEEHRSGLWYAHVANALNRRALPPPTPSAEKRSDGTERM